MKTSDDEKGDVPMVPKKTKTPQPHMCVDRVVPAEHKIETARRAIAINPANDPSYFLRKHRRAGATFHPYKIALEAGKLWRPGQTLRIRFLDGSSVQRERTEAHASKWLAHANLKFDFKGGAGAEIRVSFTFDPGSSWSSVGTDALSPHNTKSEPTMNFGWLDDDTSDLEYARVVIHEFGHALGCIHEHENPKGGIVWNKPAVYKAFSGPPNHWTKEEIDFNVLDRYSEDQINGTKFDPKSIMLYAFAPSLILAPKALAKTGTRENSRLSAGDKRYIKKMYP